MLECKYFTVSRLPFSTAACRMDPRSESMKFRLAPCSAKTLSVSLLSFMYAASHAAVTPAVSIASIYNKHGDHQCGTNAYRLTPRAGNHRQALIDQYLHDHRSCIFRSHGRTVQYWIRWTHTARTEAHHILTHSIPCAYNLLFTFASKSFHVEVNVLFIM